MKHALFPFALLVAAAGIARPTRAQVPRPVPMPAPRVSPANMAQTFEERTRGRNVTVAGKTIPAHDYFANTPRETAVKLASGQPTTMGHLVDLYGHFIDKLKAQGKSPGDVQKVKWVDATTPAAVARETATQNDPSMRKRFGTANQTCPTNDCSKKRQIGVDDQSAYVIAPYNHLALGSDNTAPAPHCTASWNAGVAVYGRTFDFVKVTAGMSGGNGTGISANITIAVMGKTLLTGDMDIDPFIRAFSTSSLPGGDPTTTLNIMPGVDALATAGASFALRIDPTASAGDVLASTKSVGAYCGLAFVPSIRSKVHARAEVQLGPDVMGDARLLTISAHGYVVPIDFDLPAIATLAMHDGKIDYGFDWGLHWARLRGKLTVDWQLPDPDGVFQDGLGLSTSGTIKTWDASGWTNDAAIVSDPIQPKIGTETLSPAWPPRIP